MSIHSGTSKQLYMSMSVPKIIRKDKDQILFGWLAMMYDIMVADQSLHGLH